MLELHLSDGKVIQRIAAGYITTEAELDRFVAEARKELALHEGETMLLEMWELVSHLKIKLRRKLPTEEEEMTATQ